MGFNSGFKGLIKCVGRILFWSAGYTYQLTYLSVFQNGSRSAKH